MSKINLIDTHIHSDNSKDAHHSVTLICEKAIEKGLIAIAVTDHCELLEYEESNYAVTCRQSAFEVCKARAVFEGQIDVASGVELGCPTRNLEAVEDVLRNNFDFVLASVHRIKGKKKGFMGLDYSRESNAPELLISRYLDDIIETVEWNGFDSLAHLTYPLRYYPASLIENFDIMIFKDKLYYIFETLAKNGKALEINTAGKDYKIKGISSSFHPCFELVKMFKQAGGEYITIGSDAHYAENVGRKIEDAMEIAKMAGFNYMTYYKNRLPISVKIE